MCSKCTCQFSQSEKHRHFRHVTTCKARSLTKVRWSVPCLAHLFSFHFTFHFLFTASPLPCPFQPTPLHAPIHKLKRFCWELYIQWMTGDHRRSSCSWNSQMVVIILHFTLQRVCLSFLILSITKTRGVILSKEWRGEASRKVFETKVRSYTGVQKASFQNNY